MTPEQPPEAPIQLLICEGACNPDLIAVDQAIAQWRQDERHALLNGKCLAVDDDALVQRLRQLVHTAHRPQADGIWQCSVCLTLRKAPTPCGHCHAAA